MTVPVNGTGLGTATLDESGRSQGDVAARLDPATGKYAISVRGVDLSSALNIPNQNAKNEPLQLDVILSFINVTIDT